MGFLICIEGIDGAGKRTQAGLLRDYLLAKGRGAVVYAYPDYESRYGKIINEFLSEKAEMEVGEQFLLYLLDKESSKKRIMDDLKSGKVVITDRYFISNIAYQVAGGFDYDAAKRIIELMELPEPDLVFYLSVPIDVSIKRKTEQKGKTDRFEGSGGYLAKVMDVYERLYADGYGAGTWIKIDGTGSREEISTVIAAESAEALTL